MKICLIILSGFLFTSMRSEAQTDSARYVLERDDEVAKTQAGPHDGGGSTIGYSFFDKVSDYKTAFKKRVLKKGSSIGYHLQAQDEIYYILSGKGEMRMNGEKFSVKTGRCNSYPTRQLTRSYAGWWRFNLDYCLR